MGEMIYEFDSVQRCRLDYSDRVYSVQKLVEVSVSKEWWT
jgi:hypothetical protein